LLSARLLARDGFAVTLYERLDPGAATYGFGVALAGQATRRLHGLDPEAADRIEPLCHPLRRWTMWRESESASVEDRGAAGVERAGLLATLQALAVEAGAEIVAGREARIEDVGDTADIVILADGVGSLGREALAPRIGVQVDTVAIPYMWCGANLDLESMNLYLRRTEHGIFCAHVMPYGGDGDCTFQVDTVPAALRSAGLAENQGEGDAGSDEASLHLLSGTFSGVLGDHRLLGNRSRWNMFRLVTCERWSDGKFVLLGDAAHTAHYTVGSGTRMAMEDAMALSSAIAGEASIEGAFAAYERERRPAVEWLQWRAARSQTWWRTLKERYDLPLAVLLFSYFTRTGSVGFERLARSNPDVVEAVLEKLPRPDAGSPLGTADDPLAGRVLDRADLGSNFSTVRCDGVTPWSERSHGLIAGVDGLGAILEGDGRRQAVLDRFDVAEELRKVTRSPVAVAVPADALDDAATAIAAHRADYVVIGG
jgi:anthraniloyl-CoA monooxygenase